MSTLSIRSFVTWFSLAVGGLAALLLLEACGTVRNLESSIDPAAVRSLGEVSVVSIRAPDLWRREMGADAVGSTPTDLADAIREDTEKAERRAYPSEAAMTYTRDYLFGEFQSAVPFSLTEEQPLLESAAYQTFDATEGRLAEFGSQRADSSVTTPEGYRSLNPTMMEDQKLRELFGLLPASPNGMMFVKTQYTLIQDDVKHEERAERTARAKRSEEDFREVMRSSPKLTEGDTVFVDVKAKTEVRVVDRQGSTVLKAVRSARSDERFQFVYGQGWTAEDAEGPAMDATEQALRDVTAYVQSNVSE